LITDDLISGGDMATTLGSVRKLWIFHNPDPVHPGLTGAGVLGVDNLHAAGMPVVPSLLGDYNDNGVVEQADLDLVLLNWGNATVPPPAGWVSDLPEGQVDQDELDGVLLHWGNAAEQVSAASIPEPAAAALTLICACLMLGRICLSRVL
jgi:hypothetical protein